MLFRNLFLKYHKPEPTPPGGAPAPTPEPTPTPTPEAPTFTAAQIAWMMANNIGTGQAQQPTPPAPQKSAYDMQREKQQEEADKTKLYEEMERRIIFKGEFDGVLEKHKALFSMSGASIRAAADGLKDEALCNQLQAVAAKAFFDSEKNLALLTPGEQEFVKSAIAGKHESQIDSPKAWELVKRALFTSDLISRNNDIRGTGNGGGGDMLANVDAFIKKAMNKFKRAPAQ